MRLYVTGGRQKTRIFKREEEWNVYERALLLEVDPDKGTAETRLDYQSPPEACADGSPSILFKTGTLEGGKLYLCTSTEVLIYQVPEFKRAGYVSLPCFNDLHHVTPGTNGSLLAASTGLDLVVEFTAEGKVLREWNVLGEDPWRRFSKKVDYRKVLTTKPHLSHPNFVFMTGEDVWVTRFNQKDALCLTLPAKRIAIDLEKPHDGQPFNGKLYFTTVDGRVVIGDLGKLEVTEVIDLNPIDNPSGALLGWCRGLYVVDERHAWVGFTRVRKTKFKENIAWVKHAFRDTERPTHIALYDLRERRLLKEVDLEKHGLNVVFSLHPVPAR